MRLGLCRAVCHDHTPRSVGRWPFDLVEITEVGSALDDVPGEGFVELAVGKTTGAEPELREVPGKSADTLPFAGNKTEAESSRVLLCGVTG